MNVNLSLDLAYGDTFEDHVKQTFAQAAEHSVTVKLIADHGPAGSWPVWEIDGDVDDVARLLLGWGFDFELVKELLAEEVTA